MSVRVSLRGMLRLVRVDILRRVHNVGFSRDGLNVHVSASAFLDCCDQLNTDLVKESIIFKFS